MLTVRVLLALTATALLCAEDFTGRVVGVSDGDTIRVLREGRAVRVRLWGIDSPESGQPFSARAKQFTSKRAFGKDVKVRVRDVDRYRRIVGEVILPDGANLNHELVRAGLAWWYRQYAPRDTTLESLEHKAREAKLGVWSDGRAVPPWEWRKVGNKSPAARRLRVSQAYLHRLIRMPERVDVELFLTGAAAAHYT